MQNNEHSKTQQLFFSFFFFALRPLHHTISANLQLPPTAISQGLNHWQKAAGANSSSPQHEGGHSYEQRRFTWWSSVGSLSSGLPGITSVPLQKGKSGLQQDSDALATATWNLKQTCPQQSSIEAPHFLCPPPLFNFQLFSRPRCNLPASPSVPQLTDT